MNDLRTILRGFRVSTPCNLVVRAITKDSISTLKNSQKKWRDSLETRAVDKISRTLLIFLLELEIPGVAVQSIHQNSKKWRL